MIDLVNIIPIEYTILLNAFNKELNDKRHAVEMSASNFRVRLNNFEYEGIKIRYSQKNTTFFFEIDYLLKGDFINWKFYPFAKNSTKEKITERIILDNAIKKNELLSDLRLWRNNIIEIDKLENPLDFFKTDNFIKFYASEFIEEFNIEEQDEKSPLPTQYRKKILELLNKQIEFIKIELSGIEDIDSEKYQDLTTSQELLSEISENIPRMTIADIKRNWAIPLGAIRKWCEDQYLKFLILDNNSDYKLSRSLGSFIGGLFNLPQLED